jgi:small subunit ribosomal protein S6
MREYELTVLIHPDLEADLEKPLGVVRDIVTKNKGKVVSEDNWGKKRLAYRIAREDFAVYVHMVLELPASAVAKVDSTLNITDSVLRHLLVSVDPKAKAAQAEAAAKKSSDDETTEEE